MPSVSASANVACTVVLLVTVILILIFDGQNSNYYMKPKLTIGFLRGLFLEEICVSE